MGGSVLLGTLDCGILGLYLSSNCNFVLVIVEFVETFEFLRANISCLCHLVFHESFSNSFDEVFSGSPALWGMDKFKMCGEM